MFCLASPRKQRFPCRKTPFPTFEGVGDKIGMQHHIMVDKNQVLGTRIFHGEVLTLACLMPSSSWARGTRMAMAP